MRLKGILYILFFLSFFHKATAAYEFTPELMKAYKLMLKLKVDSGDVLAKEQITRNPKNGQGYLVANYGDFLRLMFTEDHSLYIQLKKNQALRIEKVNKLEKLSPYYKYILGEIYLQWALVKIKYGNETDGVFDFIKAYRLLKDNEEKYPSFILHKKSLGFLHVLLGSIPDRYKWLAKTLGFSTNQKLGLDELKQVTDSINPLQTEALMLNEWLSFNILKDNVTEPKALKSILLSEKDNLLAVFLYASIVKKSGHGTLALEALSKWDEGNEYLFIPYVKYLKGGLYLQKAAYTEAITNLKEFLASYKGENFKKDALYKISLSYRLMGNETEAKKYAELVSEKGIANFEADKYAQKMVLSNTVSDNRLLKARFYSDGGYLQEAINLLEGLSVHSFKTQTDKTEFLYRTGRILDLQNQKEKAIIFYEKAIVEQQEAYYYFAPNACLHLGYIYMNKDAVKARMYFKKATSYKNHEYKNSIDTKAKVALNELKLSNDH